MIKFLSRRLGEAGIVLLVLSAIVFAMSRMSGDPADLLLGPDATEADRERFREAHGLDRPLVEQFLLYLRGMVTGDLGTSLRSGEPVLDLLGDTLGASLALASAAMLIVFVAGIPLGVVAALWKDRALDQAVRAAAVLGQSVPSFWFGIILIQVFAVRLGWLPAGGNRGVASVVLPALTLAIGTVLAGVVRLVRTSMLEILDSEFIRFARANGLAERVVIFSRALRNAMVPTLAFMGLYFPIFIGMNIVVEVVFSWPGVGSLSYTAILVRDYPVVQGVVMAIGVCVVLASLTVDLILGLVDPRVRTSSERRP